METNKIEDAEIRGVIPPYYSFIIDKVNRIFYLWDEAKDQVAALQCAIRLTKFLPVKLKKQIKDETESIKVKLETASKGQGYDFVAATNQIRNAQQKIAYDHLDKYVDKLTSLLDQEHMLTQSYGIPTRARGMGDIQRTVDKARYDAGE